MPSPSNPQDFGVLHKLAAGLETTLLSIRDSRQHIDEAKNQIQRTSEDLIRLRNETATSLVSVKGDLQFLRDNVVSLSKVIREGEGGTDPLTTRLRLAEAQILELNARLDRHTREIHKRIDEMEAEDLTDKQGSWQLKAAIVTSIGSLVAAAIALLS